MATHPGPLAPVRALPTRPHLEHLRNEAKRRLKALRADDPQAKLAAAQLAVARDYGFASWRQLKAQVDRINAADSSAAVFAAARKGDIDAVRRALEAGFDPGLVDRDGKTIHQIAKTGGHEAIELLAREFQERDARPQDERRIIAAMLDAAEKGHVDALRLLIEERPDLINARGGDFQKQTALHKAAWRNRSDCVRLLLGRGADARIRDFGDNAYALHFAAESADFDIIERLVDAGSDVVGEGDDHGLAVIGWATCFSRVREDVADYLVSRGAQHNLWSAIALGRVADVERMLARDPQLINARMSRNEHRRTPLHHAAMKNQPAIVRLLLERGADAQARDESGTNPLGAAAQAKADDSVAAMLREAGAPIDFIAAINLKRYDLAEAMLREDPTRIGRDGRDTVALHLAAAGKNAETVRWLIAHGVDVNAKRSLWDCNYTALHAAAADGAVDIVRLLLDAGGDPDIHDDKYDSTVLGWAEYLEQEEVARLLRERRAAS